MFIIVGLGNPGKQYDNTRHNAGFMVIDELADQYNISVTEKKWKALAGKGMIGGEKVVLLKPQTFMNLSGESIREAVDFFKIDTESELIVISDDISLDTGRIRVRKKGSAGGHNGLKNIILHLGNDHFMRVKLGVGEKPNGGDLVNHVLGHFAGEDRDLMSAGVKTAADAVVAMMQQGPDVAMNLFNGKKEE